MNYMDSSQFRFNYDHGEIYLTCTLCQGSTDDLQDLRDAIEAACRHAEEVHECPLEIEGAP